MSVISVLIPTRGRPNGLFKAVSSMVSRAARPDQLEFLLRSDDDQLATMPVIEPILQVGRCAGQEYRGPRGAGYRDVYKMYNALAEQSTGDILFNGNDDLEFLTDGWDEIIRSGPPHSVQFIKRDILPPGIVDTTFPFTHRTVYEAMGHLAMQVHADDWMGHVARDAGVAVFVESVRFHHDRLNDQTSFDRDHGGYDTAGFATPEMAALRAIDVAKVRAADPRCRG